MTNQQPPAGPDTIYRDAAPPAGSSGLAMASMVLGIFGLLTSCVGVGFFAGLIAAVLGCVAVARINRDPARHGGKGFALAGLGTGVVGALLSVPLTIMVVMMVMPNHSSSDTTGATTSTTLSSTPTATTSGTPSTGGPSFLTGLGRARELSNRSYCAANLRGIAMSMVVYANENSDVFPVTAPPARATQYSVFTTSAAGTTGDKTLEGMYASGGVRGDVTATLWIMVLKQQTTPKQYLCKSDPFANALAAPVNANGTFLTNFTGGNGKLSYSIAYPWLDAATSSEGDRAAVVGGWWKNQTDASLPVMADMAPLQGSGARPSIDVQAGGSARAWNSRNHSGDGQTVVYGDVHAAFERSPQVGHSQDNIWTSSQTGGPATGGIAPGTTPGRLGAPVTTTASPMDTVMVPVRNVDTGAVQ